MALLLALLVHLPEDHHQEVRAPSLEDFQGHRQTSLSEHLPPKVLFLARLPTHRQAEADRLQAHVAFLLVLRYPEHQQEFPKHAMPHTQKFRKASPLWSRSSVDLLLPHLARAQALQPRSFQRQSVEHHQSH